MPDPNCSEPSRGGRESAWTLEPGRFMPLPRDFRGWPILALERFGLPRAFVLGSGQARCGRSGRALTPTRDSPPQKGDSALPKSRLGISEKPTRKQPFSLGDSGLCDGDSASSKRRLGISEKPTRRFSLGDTRFCAGDSMRVCDDNGVAARRRR